MIAAALLLTAQPLLDLYYATPLVTAEEQADSIALSNALKKHADSHRTWISCSIEAAKEFAKQQIEPATDVATAAFAACQSQMWQFSNAGIALQKADKSPAETAEEFEARWMKLERPAILSIVMASRAAMRRECQQPTADFHNGKN